METQANGSQPACPSCGQASAPAFVAHDYNRKCSTEAFQYFECAACRLLFLDPIPTDLGRFYPRDYYSLSSSRDELRRTSGHDRYKIEIVTRFASKGRLLEIGPGLGGFCLLASDAGFDVHAIEMDRQVVEFLRGKIGVDATASDNPTEAVKTLGVFDVIALWHVIEHVPRPFDLFAACAQALAPGGVLLIAAPNPNAFQFRVFGKRWVHLDAPRHVTLPPEALLSEKAFRYGLERLECTTNDAGGLHWNTFGWSESLRALAPHPFVGRVLGRVGRTVARAFQPIDRAPGLGSAYTVVYRKPGEGKRASAP